MHVNVSFTIPGSAALVRSWRWTLLAALVLGFTLAGGGSPAHAAFPGANGKIAFTTDRDGNTEIYVMNADGTGQTRLTNNPSEDRFEEWSPDGTKLTFARDQSDVWKMNADGTGQTQVTFYNTFSTAPGSWSPDGTKIAFYSHFETSTEQIYVMNADGTGVARLTNLSTDNRDPRFSPDGTKIAWGNGCCATEIYVMNADGTGQTNLTNNPARDIHPDWSPGGTKIAFDSDRDGNEEIYVMNADGSGLTRLTNNTSNDNYPSWSPDGTKIAFHSDRDGNNEIYVMNANGSSQTRLTNNSAGDFDPRWQPLAPQSVGGIAELPGVVQRASQEQTEFGTAFPLMAALVGAAAVGVVGLGGAAWYVRRRRVR